MLKLKQLVNRPLLRQRPLFTLPQILIFACILFALVVAVDLNRREQSGLRVGASADVLQAEVDTELTRQVELQATLTYVQGDEYIAAYARNEAGLVQADEVRVVPLPLAVTPQPAVPAAATPDPLTVAKPWQAWWQLLTDYPLPTR